MKTKSIGAITGPFVSAAAARGAHAPLRLIGQDARGWQVAERRGDVLVLDEFGDLWWANIFGGDARVIRECWPEESRSFREQIEHALSALLV
jgi:hypothetical protein